MKPADYLALFIPLMIAVVVIDVVVTRYLSSSRQIRAGRSATRSTGRWPRVPAAQRHGDHHAGTRRLRLTDLSVQVDALRAQLDQMQRILTEVE